MTVFYCCFVLPYFYYRIECSVGLNCDQWKRESNIVSIQWRVTLLYMTMRDYRNLAFKNQQPWERNPNPPRSMRDYRDQWMIAPSYMVPPQYTSAPQPPQPPQLISPVEQAILNLSKIVDNFTEEKRVVTVQVNQETDTVKSSLNKELDGFQSKIDQKLDILQIHLKAHQ